MALTGVLRPGYIQIRVIDIQAALTHYIDRLGFMRSAGRRTGACICVPGMNSIGTA
jgi:catechol 2,3-dioxygenase